MSGGYAVAARLASFVAVVALASAASASTPEPAAVDRVGGEAYALAVGMPPQPVPGSPRLLLPPGGGTLFDSSAGMDILTGGGVTTADQLGIILDGAVEGDGAAVSSTATVGFVELFDGVIRATNVLVVATTTLEGGRAYSGASSTFGSLLVGGLSYPSPRPNERVELPGLGHVVLNEQLVGGDGLTSSSTIVRALRLRVTAPNVQDVPPGTEFVVASAASGVPDVAADTPVLAEPLASGAPLPSIPISTRGPIDTRIDETGGIEPLSLDNGDDNDDDDDEDADDNDEDADDNAADSTTATGSSRESQSVVVTVVVVVATPASATPKADSRTPTATRSRASTPTRTPTPRR